MPMEPFQHSFPELAAKETRVLTVLKQGSYGSLPADDYGFVELFCNEKNCDCRRVMVTVMARNATRPMATINMGFDSRAEHAGPFLDPLSPQSEHAQTLMQCFLNEVNDAPGYLERLQRHYVMFKEKLEGRPYRGRPFESTKTVKRVAQRPGSVSEFLEAPPATEPFTAPARRGRKIGRNEPCPCGSGKKYKKCCMSKEQSPLASGKRKKPTEPVTRRKSGDTGSGDGEVDAARTIVARVAGHLRRQVPGGALEDRDQKLLEHRPRMAFALLDLLLDVHAPDGRQREPSPEYEACLILLEEALTQIRYSVERHRPWAIEAATDIQDRIATRAFRPEVDARVQHDLLKSLYSSKLELHPSIKAQSEKLSDYYARFTAKDGPPDMARLAEQLAQEDAEDAFELFETLVGQLSVLAPEGQAMVIGELAKASRHALVMETVGLALLHADPEVRRIVPALLAHCWDPDAVSPLILRRLVGLRNWLPAAEHSAVDDLVKNIRKRHGALGLESSNLPPPRTAEVHLSPIDGSGAQAAWWLCRERRPFHSLSILVKQGHGVRDVWAQLDLSQAELQASTKHLRTVGSKPVQRAYADRLISHSVAIGAQQGNPPPVRLLQAAEIMGRSYWTPQRVDPALELARLEERIGPDARDPDHASRALNESGKWPAREDFAASWFDDDARVDELLHEVIGPADRWLLELERASRVLMEEVLAAKRQVWAERLLWMALWAEAVKGRRKPPWKNFAVLARELRGERPLEAIPLMRAVAERSVYSALQRAKMAQK